MSPKYDVAINTAGTSGNATMVTVTVPVGEGVPHNVALEFLRSMVFKQELSEQLVSRHKLPRGGIVPVGGPNPVFTKAGDRSTPVTGYSQDFKWTASI